MSCITQTSQPIRLTVTAGNLPEGYCPANYQQLFNDMATRLIVTPNQNNSTFVTGSTEPTSNVGPWLKNCEEWFVFDDATGRYRPTPIGVFKNMRYYTSNDTFVVPDNIFKLKVSAWGAGGGGCATSGGVAGAGGGAGGYGIKIFDVVPTQSIGVSVGIGGAAGGATGGTGGSTTFLTLVATGGTGGSIVVANAEGGVGGTATGADFFVNGGCGNAVGNGGGGGIDAAASVGIGGVASHGGDGGKCSAIVAKSTGIVPGGGGAGQSTSSAPAGATGPGGSGSVLVEY